MTLTNAIRRPVLRLALFACLGVAVEVLGVAQGRASEGIPTGLADSVNSIVTVTEHGTGWRTTGWVERSVRSQSQNGILFQNVVITNAHLVGRHASSDSVKWGYTIRYAGENYRAYRLGYYRSKTPDLAAFLFKTPSHVPFLNVATEDPRPGEYVQTGGYPGFAQGKRLYSQGQVTGGPSTAIKASYQSASGQSGSPVLNASGVVVGVNWGRKPGSRVSGPGIFVGCRQIRGFLRRLGEVNMLPRGYSNRPFNPPGGT